MPPGRARPHATVSGWPCKSLNANGLFPVNCLRGNPCWPPIMAAVESCPRPAARRAIAANSAGLSGRCAGAGVRPPDLTPIWPCPITDQMESITYKHILDRHGALSGRKAAASGPSAAPGRRISADNFARDASRANAGRGVALAGSPSSHYSAPRAPPHLRHNSAWRSTPHPCGTLLWCRGSFSWVRKRGGADRRRARCLASRR